MGQVCPTLFPQLNATFRRALEDEALRARLMDATEKGEASELVNTALNLVSAYELLDSGVGASKAWPRVQSTVITGVARVSLSSGTPINFIAGSVEGQPQTTIVITDQSITITCDGSP